MTSPEFKPKPLWQILGDEPPIEWRLEQEDRARRQAAMAPAQPVRTDAGETYGPPTPPLVPMNLPGFGQTYFNPAVAPKLRDFIDRTRQAGMDVQFTSGFRTTAKQAGLPDDPSVTTAAAAGNSLHEAGNAFDINLKNLDKTPRYSDEQMRRIVDFGRQSGFNWGGDFRKPDPVHFYIEVPEGRDNRAPRIQRAQDFYRNSLDSK